MLVVAGIYILFFSRLCTIEFIDVSAPGGIDQTSVRSVVFDQMAHKRFGLLSQKNIFALSQKELETNLKKKFVVDTFSLRRMPPHTLVVTVSGRPFRLLWVARDTVYDVSSDGTLSRLIDPLSPVAVSALSAKNRASGETNTKNLKPRTDIPIVVEDDELVHSPGENVLAPDMLVFLVDAWRLFDQSGIHFAYALLGKDNPTVTLVTTDNWRVLLSTLADPQTQLDHVREVLNRHYKAQRNGLQYIDARFDNRVYYK